MALVNAEPVNLGFITNLVVEKLLPLLPKLLLLFLLPKLLFLLAEKLREKRLPWERPLFLLLLKGFITASASFLTVTLRRLSQACINL